MNVTVESPLWVSVSISVLSLDSMPPVSKLPMLMFPLWVETRSEELSKVNEPVIPMFPLWEVAVKFREEIEVKAKFPLWVVADKEVLLIFCRVRRQRSFLLEGWYSHCEKRMKSHSRRVTYRCQTQCFHCGLKRTKRTRKKSWKESPQWLSNLGRWNQNSKSCSLSTVVRKVKLVYFGIERNEFFWRNKVDMQVVCISFTSRFGRNSDSHVFHFVTLDEFDISLKVKQDKEQTLCVIKVYTVISDISAV